MKWGRKKPPPSSPSTSSRLSFISNVLPSSWLTKFKRMSINSGQDTPNSKPRGKWNSVYGSPLRCPNDQVVGGGGGGGEGEGFHGGEDDAFWRLSFREEIVEGQNSTGSVLRSVWYHNHSQDEPKLQKPSSCQGCVNIREDDEVPKFSDMVPDVRASRGLPREMEIFPENDADIREKVVEIRTPRLRIQRGKKLRKKTQRGNFSENQLQSDRELYKENVSEMEPGTKGGGHGYIIQREDCNLAGSDAGDSLNAELWEVKEKNELIAQKESGGLHEGKTLPEWQKLKEMKIEEIKQRKSLYISREATERKRPKQKTIKVKSYSPRLASKTEACKIRALEEMKRTRSKSTKKREKSKDMGLDSFAVVKTSLDPQKDFQDSMMEMIKERGISRAEELEELLACYLKLNCDEYHELIIKVFRQVWFDLNQTCNISEAENENCCYD